MTTRAVLTGCAQGLCLAVIIGLSVESALAESFSDASTLGDDELVLQGTGTASYMFWDIYDAALYAPADASREAIIDAEVPMSLLLEYRRAVDVADIRKATWAALDKQYKAQARAALRPRIEAIQNAMVDVTEGDRYRLDWAPEVPRLSLTLNGNTRFVSDDARLARAYFGIWLDEPPLSQELRDALLSRTD
ncbi:chalcone isomerase-like protein [Chromohalobacter marismortui]|uniref:Chalcone isomerase-like protein n=1 Tax=Chromohalobacter marismortui TaxID=42055 RepID=A0A4R7NW47_9GAMM|nr:MULTISPECIES: chalcone isomerase family protein [Chromohalobacter]MCI0510683.1 chalcone isomerase family protein [Chromohalobacter sp.]MCI0592016.1 chalcone isomerase family protein [Chromohalobacter sp.]TDU24740.1 chalcone isomerase-like protein [Chromohalobacter marismortui]